MIKQHTEGLSKVKISKDVVLDPETQHFVSVSCPRWGVLKVTRDTDDKLFDHHKCTMTASTVEPSPNEPFNVIIANFSNKNVRLKKGQVVDVTHPAPKNSETTNIDINTIIGPLTSTRCQKTPRTAQKKTKIIVVPYATPNNASAAPDIGNPTPRPKGLEHHKKMMTQKEDPFEDLQDDHFTGEDHNRLRNVLSEYPRLYDGTMGEINVAQHSI